MSDINAVAACVLDGDVYTFDGSGLGDNAVGDGFVGSIDTLLAGAAAVDLDVSVSQQLTLIQEDAVTGCHLVGDGHVAQNIQQALAVDSIVGTVVRVAAGGDTGNGHIALDIHLAVGGDGIAAAGTGGGAGDTGDRHVLADGQVAGTVVTDTVVTAVDIGDGNSAVDLGLAADIEQSILTHAVDGHIACQFQNSVLVVHVQTVGTCVGDGNIVGHQTCLGIGDVDTLILGIGNRDVAVDFDSGSVGEDAIEQAGVAFVAGRRGLIADDGDGTAARNDAVALDHNAGGVGVVGLAVGCLDKDVLNDCIAVQGQGAVALDAVAGVGVDLIAVHIDGDIHAVHIHIAQHHGAAVVVDCVDLLTNHILDGDGGIHCGFKRTLVADGVAAAAVNGKIGAGDQGHTVVVALALVAVQTEGILYGIGNGNITCQSGPAVITAVHAGFVAVHGHVGNVHNTLVIDSRVLCVLDGQVMTGVSSGGCVIGQRGLGNTGSTLTGVCTGTGDLCIVSTQSDMIHHGNDTLVLDAVAFRTADGGVLGDVVDHQTVAGQLGATFHKDTVVASAVNDNIGHSGVGIATIVQSRTVGIDQGGIGQVQNTAVVVHQILCAAAVGNLCAVDGGIVQFGIAVVVQRLVGCAAQIHAVDDHIAGIACQQIACAVDGDAAAVEAVAVENTVLAGACQNGGAGNGHDTVVLDAVGGNTAGRQGGHVQYAGVVDTVLTGSGNIDGSQFHLTAVVVNAVDRRTGNGQAALGGDLIVIVDAVICGILQGNVLDNQSTLVLDVVAALAGTVDGGILHGQDSLLAGAVLCGVVADTVLAGIGNRQAGNRCSTCVVVNAVLASA